MVRSLLQGTSLAPETGPAGWQHASRGGARDTATKIHVQVENNKGTNTYELVARMPSIEHI